MRKHDLFGFQNNVNGGMAEYVRLTKEALSYRVPDALPIEKAILIRTLWLLISLCGRCGDRRPGCRRAFWRWNIGTRHGRCNPPEKSKCLVVP